MKKSSSSRGQRWTPFQHLGIEVPFLCLLIAMLSEPASGAPPKNDAFKDAARLSGDSVLVYASLQEATLDVNALGETEDIQLIYGQTRPCIVGGWAQPKSLWWRYTAPRSGILFLTMLPYPHPGFDCSPVIRLWLADQVSPSFPFKPVPSPVVEFAVSLMNARYIQWPVWVEQGKEVLIQMLGDTEETYGFQLHMSAEPGPWIVEQPVGATVEDGGSVVLNAVAAGALTNKADFFPSSRLSLGTRSQWLRNGTIVERVQGPVLFLPLVTQETAGDYQWVVSDDFGSSTSQVARVVVSQTGEESPPSLEIRPGEANQPPLFTLTGQIGAMYVLESSENLLEWTSADVRPDSGVEIESRDFLFGTAPHTAQSKVAYHGVPFQFHVEGLHHAGYVRASQYQPSCEVCVDQLLAIQWAKESWGRFGVHYGTDAPAETDLAPAFISAEWLFVAQSRPVYCSPLLEIALSSLANYPLWPCPWWWNALGERIDSEQLPIGIWNGAHPH